MRSLVTSLGCAIAGLLVACSGNDRTEREPLPDWSDGYETHTPGSSDAGVVDSEAPPGAFAVLVSPGVTYPARLHELDSEDPCVVEADDPREVVYCVLDMNELDLYALGFSVDVTAPEGLCDFIEHSGFLFENWEVGEGPTEVGYTKHPDGTYSDEVNSENGEPHCEYDYSWQYGHAFDAPNCCTGSYTLTVKSAESGESTKKTEQWNPELSRCYEGGAFYQKGGEVSEDGFPLASLLYVGGHEHTERYAYDGISEVHFTNLPLANYWAPEDHDGDMPAAFHGLFAQPYYEWICEDDAAEWRADIRLLVREWNEESEHANRGDPDTTGTEADWGTPIDDLEDFADRTPGSSDFPELPPVR